MDFEMHYDVLKLLGWVTVILVVLSSSMFVLIKLNVYFSKVRLQNKWMVFIKSSLKKLTVVFRNYHKIFGAVALTTGILHGYFLLEEITFHSGYFLWGTIIFSAITGMTMGSLKGKPKYILFRKVHIYTMTILIILLIFHVLTMKDIFNL